MARLVLPLTNILIFSGFCFFVGCNAKEYDKIRSENTKLNSELKKLGKNRSDLIAKEQELDRLIYDFESLQKKESTEKIELSDIIEYHRDLEAAYDYILQLRDRWEVATRKSLVGEMLGIVRLSDGQVLTDVQILELHVDQVVFKHSKGEGAFDLSQLPESTRKRLIHETTILLESEIIN